MYLFPGRPGHFFLSAKDIYQRKYSLYLFCLCNRKHVFYTCQPREKKNPYYRKKLFSIIREHSQRFQSFLFIIREFPQRFKCLFSLINRLPQRFQNFCSITKKLPQRFQNFVQSLIDSLRDFIVYFSLLIISRRRFIVSHSSLIIFAEVPKLFLHH